MGVEQRIQAGEKNALVCQGKAQHGIATAVAFYEIGPFLRQGRLGVADGAWLGDDRVSMQESLHGWSA